MVGGAGSSRRAGLRTVLAAIYIAVNAVLVYFSIELGPDAPDWQLWSALPAALASGSVYDIEHGSIWFAWSPIMAPIMAAIALVGYWPWVAAHAVSVLALRDWRLIVLTLTSWAFWFDTAQGNTLTFCFVAGVLALRGHRSATFGYLAMTLLMPRPLMLPLAAWLLWQRREIRLPFVGLFVGHAVIVAASGDGQAWAESMLTYGGQPWTLGPTALLGAWWLVAGVPLAGLLTLRGHLGWAGLAVSPYVLPQYLLWLLFEMPQSRTARAAFTQSTHERSAQMPNDFEVTHAGGRHTPP